MPNYTGVYKCAQASDGSSKRAESPRAKLKFTSFYPSFEIDKPDHKHPSSPNLSTGGMVPASALLSTPNTKYAAPIVQGKLKISPFGSSAP